MMAKIKVNFFKTQAGRDRLVVARHFETMAEALAAVEQWEARTADNYAVFM